ncbi:MAG: methylated-DNA--[protein]-cysteine S-methyltransferase [Lachnospiraceae bacterium]|nr:methylated-DNA--[protein]-cysteine S-methyltransferase [Lachnospiraceae bacterium]
MQYISHYTSPVGDMLLAGDDMGLNGLWLEGQKYYPGSLILEYEEKELPVFTQTKEWLTVYFAGKEPDFMPPLHPIGTAFQMEVWDILRQIPYGQTITYGAIARKIAGKRRTSRMSAQAVGGAVGHNRISILIPCHRVVGADGSLTGYAGGLDMKRRLLTLEGVDMEQTQKSCTTEPCL